LAASAVVFPGHASFFANLGAFSFTYLLGYLKEKNGLFESGFFAIGALCGIEIIFTVLMERIRRVKVSEREI